MWAQYLLWLLAPVMVPGILSHHHTLGTCDYGIKYKTATRQWKCQGNPFLSCCVHSISVYDHLHWALKDPEPGNFVPLGIQGNFSCNSPIQYDGD